MHADPIHVTVEAPLSASYRSRAVAGMFDLAIAPTSKASFKAELPQYGEDWQIGLIVGPSGSGKSTIAKHAYRQALLAADSIDWPHDSSVLDGFPEQLSVRDITATLTAVGFSSPPAWLRPFHTLSGGEQFRTTLAAALLSGRELVAFDEFTSVVDRTVAKVGSAALAKQIRRGQVPVKKFVAVGCHYDVIDWLCPDWILDTATFELARRRLRRPPITLALHRSAPRAWRAFRRHHYLSGELASSCRCYLATWDGQPVTFVATIHQHGAAGCRRVSRFVTLPDYQGLSLGSQVLGAVAAEEARHCRRVRITTSHPAVISHCQRTAWWRCVDYKPLGYGNGRTRTQSTGRSVANFQFLPQEYDAHPTRTS